MADPFKERTLQPLEVSSLQDTLFRTYPASEREDPMIPAVACTTDWGTGTGPHPIHVELFQSHVCIFGVRSVQRLSQSYAGLRFL